ncbi:FAD-binding oxidoreductase [bacterium]|nr:FAD-binding oxidoreductase [bacterium]
MIPRLTESSPPLSIYADFLKALSDTEFSGDIHTDFGRRLVNATDNSIYQIVPQAVVFPRSADDITRIMQLMGQERWRDIKLAARGGGTGTNGQSLTHGLCLDMSRYMTRILDLDLINRRVRVEAGVVLDVLNETLRPNGLAFVPNVAPSSRATIGGMINTDACGKGSRVFGKTSDHVLELRLHTVGGAVVSAGAEFRSPPETGISVEDRLCVQVLTTAREHQDEIRARYPKLTRFLSGYNFQRAVGDGGVSLIPIIAGSEGSLGIVSEATLNLVPLPKATRLLVIQYADFESALAAAGSLLTFNPIAIETLDSAVLEVAKDDISYDAVKEWIFPETRALNLVELQAETHAAVDLICRKINAEYPGTKIEICKTPEAGPLSGRQGRLLGWATPICRGCIAQTDRQSPSIFELPPSKPSPEHPAKTQTEILCHVLPRSALHIG